MHNRKSEKSQIPGEGVKTRKCRLAWERPDNVDKPFDNRQKECINTALDAYLAPGNYAGLTESVHFYQQASECVE